MKNRNYIPKTKGIKMLFISHFYSFSMETSTLVETNPLVTFQVIRMVIWVSEFLVSAPRREDLIPLHLHLQMLNELRNHNGQVFLCRSQK